MDAIWDRAAAVIRQRQALLNAWASTLPGTSGDLPRPGSSCAVATCACVLRAGEECYLTVELPGDSAWVCWRHIAREAGRLYPVQVDKEYAMTEDIKIGDLFVDSGGTVRKVHEYVARDPRWKQAGWRCLRLNNGTGDGHGFTEFVPFLDSMRKIELDTWYPVIGGGLEQRWVARGSIVQRELRKVV